MAMTFESEQANILVVDDLPEKRLVYEAVLEELGENVVLVSSGAEALKQILRHHFAVILLDVNMPDMDGFETARLIRGHRRSSATPIIFLTAFADEVRTAEGYATGAVDYLPTPVVPEILRAKVRVFVDLFKMRRQVALRAEENARHDAAEETNRRLTFLADAGAVLGRSLDFQATAGDIVALTVPLLANVSVLHCELAAGQSPKYLTAGQGESSEATVSDAAELPQPMRDAMAHAQRSGQRVVVPQASADGTERPPTLLALPLLARGRVVAVLALQRQPPWGGFDMHDITMAEAYVSRAAIALDNALLHEELQKADRQKIEFLSMLAHELRNPLAPICNAVQLFRLTTPEEADLQWAGEVIERQVGQMVRLIDDLLDVSRITNGKIRLKRETVELATVLAPAIEASQPLIDEHNHQLAVSLPDRPVWIDGDRARLAQVVTNLLNNAAKYTEEGGQIWLTARREGETAVVTVRDSGIGIPADMLASIFDLFTQVDRTLDRSSGGLGIGLTLVRRLVEMHGGTVSAESRGPGCGSEFHVRLPLSVLPSANGQNSEPEQPLPDAAEQLVIKVLVVDDNIDSADTLASLFRQAGHQVQVAYDGPTGLAVAQSFQPTTVVLDIGLPGIDGYEVASRMREMEATRNALLVAVSGYGHAKDEVRSRQAGFDYHLVKPVEFKSLQSLMSAGRWSTVTPAPQGSSLSTDFRLA
jgi:signal transduction histidine kinase/DNA-binding response OmpR family regulator